MGVLVLLALTASCARPQELMLSGLNEALKNADGATVARYFAASYDSSYVFKVAKEAGGLSHLKAAMTPTPPGWPVEGGYWVVFHTDHDIEETHDPVYSTMSTSEGLRIGNEVSESAAQAARIETLDTVADLDIPTRTVAVKSTATLKRWTGDRALVFRLGDRYKVSEVAIDGKTANLRVADQSSIPAPMEGTVVRAGSLLVVWSTKLPKVVEATYGAKLDGASQDHITDKVAYVTAWWTPSIARLPHVSKVQVSAPRGWVVRSEGEEVWNVAEGDRQRSQFRCDLPISYPKVVAGQYKLAAEKRVGNATFRAFHFDPIDPDRGQKQVEIMAAAYGDLSEKLGRFPFPGYECFDAANYYGIESYSYALLAKDITTRYLAHEMTHTYLGGIVPCAYVKDCWNEGVTTYVDDILSGRFVDKPLDKGWQSMAVEQALDEMAAAGDGDGNSYWRGAYVMKMLEAEIGPQNVLAGLRAIVRDRVGKDTTWADLRPYFERAGRRDLKRFWSQWVSGRVFPTVAVIKAKPVAGNKSLTTELTIAQTGTATAYDLRFVVRLTRGAQKFEKLVTMKSQQMVITVETPFVPLEVSINPLGFALAKVGPAIAVGK